MTVASVTAKIMGAVLSAVFHSRFIKNENMSANAGAATENSRSRFRPPRGYTLTRTPCGECFMECLVPENAGTDTVIFHIHGGSFKIKLIDLYRRLALKYSRTAGGTAVYSIDYRIMPEYIFPSQLDDVMSAWDMLMSQGVKPENVIAVGDSSGANLVLALAQKLRDSGRPMPKKLVCFSLWGDMTACGESYERNCHSDPFYGIAKKESFHEHEAYFRRRPKYAGEHDLSDPYLSVSFADFSGFPPTVFFCGTAEVGESDTDTAFANALSAGIDAKLFKYDGLFHDFQLVPFLPETKDVFCKLGSILK